MRPRRTHFWALTLIFLTAQGGCKFQSNEREHHGRILNSPADDKTAARFFYDPAGEYFHWPLVFRVVKQADPLFNTAPMRDDGRTAYISLSEMRDLVQALAHSGLGWQESETSERFGSFQELALADFGLDTMDVRIVSAKGTAKAQISPKAICATLQPLDAALKTPRALWEFQIFRLQYGCQVPEFNADAYPDHF